MRFLISFFIFSVFSVSLSSCDDHEEVSRFVSIGDVLCDDHSIVSLEEYLTKTHVSAVGVVFALADDSHPVLAVMLEELPPIEFCDSLGMFNGTSCDVNALDGYANTVAMRNSRDKGKGSPLADAVFSSHRYGQSDYIPSYSECRLLFRSLAVVNNTIRILRDHDEVSDWKVIETVPDGGGCWYWTSTEDQQDQGNKAWLCSMATGGFQQTPKYEHHPARCIVAVNR